MNHSPLVSVVVATRNAERFLDQALRSIAAQTFNDHETIVVDKRSEDRTVAIAQDHGARVVQQRGSGYAGAWNEGIEAAGGRLLAFLDSDDRWNARKLEVQVELLERRPELDYALGMIRFVPEAGLPLPPGFRPELMETDHPGHMTGTMLIRREAFDAVGPFRTEYEIANDIEWFARLKDLGRRGEVAPDALLLKRLHDSNLSYFAARNANREVISLLRESVARQRQDR